VAKRDPPRPMGSPTFLAAALFGCHQTSLSDALRTIAVVCSSSMLNWQRAGPTRGPTSIWLSITGGRRFTRSTGSPGRATQLRRGSTRLPDPKLVRRSAGRLPARGSRTWGTKARSPPALPPICRSAAQRAMSIASHVARRSRPGRRLTVDVTHAAAPTRILKLFREPGCAAILGWSPTKRSRAKRIGRPPATDHPLSTTEIS
jgi:hypothetical protein